MVVDMFFGLEVRAGLAMRKLTNLEASPLIVSKLYKAMYRRAEISSDPKRVDES
jgi:hypothetical protein